MAEHMAQQGRHQTDGLRCQCGRVIGMVGQAFKAGRVGGRAFFVNDVVQRMAQASLLHEQHHQGQHQVPARALPAPRRIEHQCLLEGRQLPIGLGCVEALEKLERVLLNAFNQHLEVQVRAG
jgi:hypothetical protein